MKLLISPIFNPEKKALRAFLEIASRHPVCSVLLEICESVVVCSLMKHEKMTTRVRFLGVTDTDTPEPCRLYVTEN